MKLDAETRESMRRLAEAEFTCPNDLVEQLLDVADAADRLAHAISFDSTIPQEGVVRDMARNVREVLQGDVTAGQPDEDETSAVDALRACVNALQDFGIPTEDAVHEAIALAKAIPGVANET